MNEEQIMCFRKELLSKYSNQPEVFFEEDLLYRILDNLQSIPRSIAEKEYGLKQLIVYTIIKSEDLYLSYRRTSKTQEGRLRHKYSIGIGGHVNMIDYSKKDFLLQAVWREINEEINIESRILNGPKLICFINSNSNDVEKDHFGVVYLLEISQPKASKKGKKGEIENIVFKDISGLKAEKSYFEKWSQLLIDYLTEKERERSHY